MIKSNQDVRSYASQRGVRHWEIAEKIPLSEGNFSRKLRHELPSEEKAEIFKIIDELATQ